MVPPYSHRVSRVQWYSGYSLLFFPFAYETITLCGGPSHALLLGSNIHFAVLTPAIFLQPVWPLPRSLATTCGISVDFSSSPYLDVSVQAVPLLYLLIQYRMHRQTLCGLLHSDICGSMLAYSSPQLFAVNHVFLRLPMPRHSPCALLRFTIRSWFIFAFSQLFVVSFTRLSEFLLLVVSSYLLVVSSFAFCFQLFFFQVAFFFSVPLRTDIKR